MLPLLSAVLLASILGSPHCAGMCGPFVVVTLRHRRQRTRTLGPLVAYHGGRLLAYGVVGALAGVVGGALDIAGSFAGVAKMAATLAGITMVCVGTVTLLRHAGIWTGTGSVGPAVTRWLQPLIRASRRFGPLAQSGSLGVLTSFMPCGWLYAFAVVAAGTSNAAYGAATMLAFWLGTLPALSLVGIGAQRLLGPLRRHVSLMMGGLLIAVGLFTLATRAVPTIDGQHAVPGSLERAAEAAAQLRHTDAPCCQHGDR